jgi:hypothetical protein
MINLGRGIMISLPLRRGKCRDIINDRKYGDGN